MSEERIFFKQGDITVTNSRFVVGSQTFAIRNITSVRADKAVQDNSGAGKLIALGIVITLISMAASLGIIGILIGLAMAGSAGYAIWVKKEAYVVLLTTSGGEVQAYQSEDREFITNIVNGLNDAIVATAN